MSMQETADPDGEILARVIQSLDEGLHSSLLFFSLPHWVDDAVLERLREHQYPGSTELEELRKRGLVESWSEKVHAIRGVIRRPVLKQMLVGHLDNYRAFSLVFARAFSEVAEGGGDVFHHIESVFHRFACEPDVGAAQMLADGLTWKSEPFFAFEALAGLISVAQEQQENGLLSEPGQAFLTLLTLFNPKSGSTARAEAEVLAKLAGRRRINQLFDAELSLRRGLNHLVLRSSKEARGELARALACFRDLKLRRGEGDSLRAMGRVELREDNLSVAKDYFTAAWEVFNELQLPVSAAYCVKSLGEADFYLGRYYAAQRQFNDALEAFGQNNVGLAAANTHVVYSQLLAVTGRYVEAHHHIDRARAVYAAIDNQLGIGNCGKNSAVALFEEGRYGEARMELARAQESYANWGSVTGLANCLLWTAACLIRTGQSEDALPLLNRAYGMFDESGDRFGRASVLREQGIAFIAQENPAEGISKLTHAQHEFLVVGNEIEALASAVVGAAAAVTAGNFSPELLAQSIQIARQAQQVFADIGHKRYQQDALSLLRMTLPQSDQLSS